MRGKCRATTSEEGAQLAACGDAESLRSIREDGWIDYPAATTVLATLNEFLSRPRTTRMPGVAIYADSGMGKTMLMQRFLAEHRSTFNRTTGTERTPVLSLQMVNRPNEKRFYSQLMDVIGAPPNPLHERRGSQDRRPSHAPAALPEDAFDRRHAQHPRLDLQRQRAMLKSVAVHQQ